MVDYRCEPTILDTSYQGLVRPVKVGRVNQEAATCIAIQAHATQWGIQLLIVTGYVPYWSKKGGVPDI